MPPSTTVGAALRAALREGYGAAALRADALAGLTVGVVALPLSMALAIATGVPPQYGLYTAIVAGFVIALLGGSRCQVSGPTAAFVVVLLPIVGRFGLGGLALASCMAGFLLVIMSVARLGRYVQVIPYSVTTGFTAGIGIVIAVLQVKDFFGLQLDHLPLHVPERVLELAKAASSARLGDTIVGVGTLLVLLIAPRLVRRLPGPLVGLLAGTGLALLLGQLWPGLSIDTIGTRFSYVVDGVTHAGMPRVPPVFAVPWSLPGPDGAPLALSWDLVRQLAGPAAAIAMLGAIESLLSAVVSDGMSGHEHDSDAELFAQGIGNVLAPFFGGFAATGAIARTATNVRAGARSPIAAMVHAAFLLVAVLLIAPVLAHLPMASLAALLLVVAWRMSHVHHVLRILRKGERSDAVVLSTCLVLTVVFDMVVAVAVGIVLASLLFFRRVAGLTQARLLTAERGGGPPAPPGVLLYQVAGPLFFGAAHKAMSVIGRIQDGVRCVVLDLGGVPLLDATGVTNLESAISRIRRNGTPVVLAALQEQPWHALARSDLRGLGQVHFSRTVPRALALAERLSSPAAGPS